MKNGISTKRYALNACKAVGESCDTGADCCNSDKVGCVGGVCTVAPVK